MAAWTVSLLVLLSGGLQDGDTVLEATARMRGYLEAHPYHERVFESLVDEATARNALADLIGYYEELHARSPAEEPARVLLARLVARTGELDRALALLDTLEGFDRSFLTARLLERGADLDAAVTWYERALALCAEDGERVDVLQPIAAIQRLLGDDEAARAAWLELAELSPSDLASKLDVARQLARAGFAADALGVYREAVECAGDDPARRSRALAALGAELEQQQLGAEALVAYDEAIALLGPEHWLREELFRRSLELRAVGGTLAEWLRDQSRRAAASRELATWLDLAQGLELAGRADEAVDALLEARAWHPTSDELGTRLLRAAARAGRIEERVAEWQRRAAQAPADASNHVSLAAVLRESGADGAADRSLEQAEELANEAAPLRTVAAQWVAAGRVSAAFRALERAARLEPENPRPLLELAIIADESGDAQAAESALERANGRSPATWVAPSGEWSWTSKVGRR